MPHPHPDRPSRLKTAAVSGAAGAAVAFLGLVLVYQQHPGIQLELDRDLPRTFTGFYAPERQQGLTFAWTGAEASAVFPGADRRIAWACRIAVINWRPPVVGPATVRVTADGNAVLVDRVSAPAATLRFTVPAAPDRAAALQFTLAVSPTFQPGGGDPRDLGLAVDRLDCEPAPGGRPRPGGALFVQAVASGAILGAAGGLAGLSLSAAMLLAGTVALLQAVPLAAGLAPYGAGTPPAWRLAALFAGLGLLVVLGVEVWQRWRVSAAARLAILLSVAAAYLRLLFLLHPDKTLVDALFHAHRLEWVLEGRFYFTQLSTSGTAFPYAIGLYLFTAPWALLTTDHVTLLRVVVCTAQALAGALLYLMVVRTWDDRLTGVLAIVLFNLVPVADVVVGHANLTNAFGQAVALAAVAAATLIAPKPGTGGLGPIVLALLAALAFVSHVSTFVLLAATLIVLAGLYRLAGDAALRPAALAILAAAAIAVALSVSLYWGHFWEVYRQQLNRVRERPAAIAVVAPESGTSRAEPPGIDTDVSQEPALGRVTIPLRRRVVDALAQTRANVGWPILLLAAIGVWPVWVRGLRDRLALALTAWAITCVAFAGIAVLAPAGVRYQQDAWEFIGRVEHATAPAAVILAAAGAAWLWRRHPALRILSAGLLLWAFLVGAGTLRGWIA